MENLCCGAILILDFDIWDMFHEKKDFRPDVNLTSGLFKLTSV